jgi:hypothetical protein
MDTEYVMTLTTFPRQRAGQRGAARLDAILLGAAQLGATLAASALLCATLAQGQQVSGGQQVNGAQQVSRGQQVSGMQQLAENVTSSSPQAQKAPSQAAQTVPKQAEWVLTDQAMNAPGPDFIAFWKNFKTAASDNDRAALQRMTHVPFDFGGGSYGATEFDKVYGQIYDAKARDCLASQKPMADNGDFDVLCGNLLYIFGTEPMFSPNLAEAADGSGWRLLEVTTHH